MYHKGDDALSIQVEVWGPYACFTRPEMKTERVSYDVMTPSAARGILEAIFWHPGLRWHIDCIHVLLPIRFASIRRNEVKSVALATKARTVMQGGEAELAIYTPADIQQRAALVLQEVRYVIEAHFSMTKNAAPGDNPGKFQDIMRRRLARGQCFHTPYLGCREFPACFREWRGGDIPAIGDSRELGYMLYDLDYSDPCEIKPLFFRARLQHGVLDARNREVVS